MRRVALVLLVAALALAAGACGRKPENLPPPEDNVFPRQYPDPDLP